MKFFISLILLFGMISCGKLKFKDIGSEEEKAMISLAVKDINMRFKRNGSDIIVSENSIKVVDATSIDKALDDYVLGACFMDSKQILISNGLFQDDEYSESVLWNTLLHEIGHCYFGKRHTESSITLPKSREFENMYIKTPHQTSFLDRPSALSNNDIKFCSHVCSKEMHLNIMHSTPFEYPKSNPNLRNYYIKSLFQVPHTSSFEDFLTETDSTISACASIGFNPDYSCKEN